MKDVKIPATTGFPLAARMSDAWIAFARDGDPNTKDLPRWDPYTPENCAMLFDNNSGVVKGPRREARLILEERDKRKDHHNLRGTGSDLLRSRNSAKLAGTMKSLWGRFPTVPDVPDLPR
jgi:hypothetical protein